MSSDLEKLRACIDDHVDQMQGELRRLLLSDCYIVASDYMITYITAKLEQQLGFPNGFWIGKDYRALFAREDLEELRCLMDDIHTRQRASRPLHIVNKANEAELVRVYALANGRPNRAYMLVDHKCYTRATDG